MSTEKIVDRFHFESLEGVDAVLARMCRAINAIPDSGYADALDVSKETVKTWRRRGEVPMKYLAGFAKQHGASLDYLKYGTEVHNEPIPVKSVGIGETAVDVALVVKIAASVETALTRLRARIPLDKKEELVRLLYEYFALKGHVEEDTIERHLKLVVNQ